MYEIEHTQVTDIVHSRRFIQPKTLLEIPATIRGACNSHLNRDCGAGRGECSDFEQNNPTPGPTQALAPAPDILHVIDVRPRKSINCLVFLY